MNQENHITWLDYSINNNLNGVLKVLTDFGYTGMLAPQSVEEVKECSLDLMDQHGDEGAVELLSAHPEYKVFEELFLRNSSGYSSKYHNAIGNVSTRINSFVSKLRPVDQMFVAAGIFLGAYYILQETKK